MSIEDPRVYFKSRKFRHVRLEEITYTIKLWKSTPSWSGPSSADVQVTAEGFEMQSRKEVFGSVASRPGFRPWRVSILTTDRRRNLEDDLEQAAHQSAAGDQK